MHHDQPSLDELATRQHGVLNRAQLAEAGYSAERIKSQVRLGRFRRLPGGCVALAGTTPSWLQRAAWAGLAVQPVGGVGYRTAARLHGLRTVDDDLDVVIRHPRKRSLPGVKVVRSRDLMKRDLMVVDGIPTTTPTRTLCDLGLIFPEHEVMRMLRHAVATGLVDAADVARLRKRVGAQGRNGAGVIGRCLDELPNLAAETESGLEVLFLEICERHRLPTPHLQLPVLAAGRRYRLDFAYPHAGIFIEIDGASAHGESRQIAADDGRQNDLVGSGWRPVRFTHDQLKHEPDRCAAQVRDLLRICAPFGFVSNPNGAQIA